MSGDEEEWDVTLADLEDDESATATPAVDSLSIGSLVRRAVADLGSTSGAQLLGLMFAVGAVTTVASQTLVVELTTYLDATVPADQRAELPDPANFPLAIDVPWAAVAVMGAVLLLLPFVAEALRIVAIRAFYEGESDGVPRELATNNLALAVLRGWLGGVLLLIAVSIGSVLLLVPGLFIAVSTLFYHQEVAVADESVLGALSASWSRSTGHRWALLGLVFVIAAVGAVPIVLPFLVPPTSVVGPLVSVVFTPVTTLFSIGLVTEAYRDLREPSDADS